MTVDATLEDDSPTVSVTIVTVVCAWVASDCWDCDAVTVTASLALTLAVTVAEGVTDTVSVGVTDAVSVGVTETVSVGVTDCVWESEIEVLSVWETVSVAV